MQYVRETNQSWKDSLNPMSSHFCDRCGAMIIKSQVKKQIDEAMQQHYGGCALFDELA
jgi:hypothetical protein